jgi:GDP-L-fucose synthase
LNPEVAVAGGFGFLGGSVVRQLESRGYRAIPFSRRSGVDLTNLDETVRYLKKTKPGTVINAAANVGGIAYNAIAPDSIFEDNLRIGTNLAQGCFEAGVERFVNIMPNCTYPGLADVYKEEHWWDGPMHDSVLAYGMPRKALWVYCWCLKQKHGFNSIHLILPNLYGPGDHFDEVRSHALGALVRKIADAKARSSPKVTIWGTGSPIREWGYVDDAAEGIVLSMELYHSIEVMNIGQGKGWSITEIASRIKEAFGWTGEFEYDTTKPDGAPRKVLDVEKMKKILGWEPKTELEEGIRRTVDWYGSAGRAEG